MRAPPVPGAFERARARHKSGVLSGCLVFFKSTVGLGLLVSQYFFGRAGLVLGTLTTVLTTTIIGYTMHLVVAVADKMEADGSPDVENYDQITEALFGRAMMVVTKVFCFLFNEGIVLVNITNLAGFLLDHLGHLFPSSLQDPDFFKLVAILLIQLTLIFILEPEKIKYPSYAAAIVLFVATGIMWVMGYVQLARNAEPKPFDLFSLPDFPAVIGNQLYAFESIGTLFTVRSTLARRGDMHRVLLYTFLLIFFLFATNGVTFLIVG